MKKAKQLFDDIEEGNIKFAGGFSAHMDVKVVNDKLRSASGFSFEDWFKNK